MYDKYKRLKDELFDIKIKIVEGGCTSDLNTHMISIMGIIYQVIGELEELREEDK